MRLVSNNQSTAPTPPGAPRLYFIHIPKTAGVTIKAFLENHYAGHEAFIMDEWKARDLPPEQLAQYRLFSGHYSSQVLTALDKRPDLIITLVREPVARFRSWAAHGRRSSYWKYKKTCTQGTDLEIALADDSYAGRQAHWLRRAFHEDGDWKGIPSADELPALLDQVDVPGMVEEIERFRQLVAFRMGWPAPDLGWHLNRRPDAELAESPALAEESAALREALAVDVALYAQVRARFWQRYAEMLSTIDPAGDSYTPESAASMTVDMAQIWLRQWHETQLTSRFRAPAERLEIASDQPLEGHGWWWRERPGASAYRWSGPGPRAVVTAAPLVTDRHYALTIDVMGAADWETWEQVGVEINGQPVPVVHERQAPKDRQLVTCQMSARLDPAVIARQDGLTRIAFTVPATKQTLAHIQREESQDTFNNDMREVGVAIHRISIEPTAPPLTPTLSLRRVA